MRDRGRAIDLFLRPSRPALLLMAAALLAADQALVHTGDGVWTAGPLDETAHFLTAALVLAALRGYVGRAFAVGLLAASVLIDLDHVPGRLGIEWVTRGTPRPYTHSLLSLVAVGLVAFAWRSRRSLLLGMLLGLAAHFYRDTSESPISGVALFWPWSENSYTSQHWIYLVVMGGILVAALSRARRERTTSMGYGRPRLAPAAKPPHRPGRHSGLMDAPAMSFREWVLQDWRVNAGRPESQLILAWFRLAQWAAGHWGPLARLVVTPCWLTQSLVLGVELPVTAKIGPRLRLYHPHGIVISPHSSLGGDCQLRQGVTVGNRVDRADREIGVASVGDHVDLGAGCVVLGDIHVGDHARVGALAVVLHSVPAWGVVVGNPGRVIRIDEPDVALAATRAALSLD
ncbi:MAG TPA: serine acetyltransferase [Solirubrobacteraceae bacterium]|jgi:serine acetyltransferase/membrane-bound metal-dependent hydrolase YbcI (DUF457 family)